MCDRAKCISNGVGEVSLVGRTRVIGASEGSCEVHRERKIEGDAKTTVSKGANWTAKMRGNLIIRAFESMMRSSNLSSAWEWRRKRKATIHRLPEENPNAATVRTRRSILTINAGNHQKAARHGSRQYIEGGEVDHKDNHVPG